MPPAQAGYPPGGVTCITNSDKLCPNSSGRWTAPIPPLPRARAGELNRKKNVPAGRTPGPYPSSDELMGEGCSPAGRPRTRGPAMRGEEVERLGDRSECAKRIETNMEMSAFGRGFRGVRLPGEIVLADSLVVELDRLEWTGASKAFIVPARDPLGEMSKFRWRHCRCQQLSSPPTGGPASGMPAPPWDRNAFRLVHECVPAPPAGSRPCDRVGRWSAHPRHRRRQISSPPWGSPRP